MVATDDRETRDVAAGPQGAPGRGGGAAAPGGRKAELAQRVVELARFTMLSDNHFLTPAVELLEPVAQEGLGAAFATDGRHLFFDPDRVLEEFADTRQPPVHDLTHVVVHCLLLHPFTTPAIDPEPWAVASDVIAERLTAELCGKRPGARGQALDIVLSQLEADLGERPTTEKVYRALEEGRFAGVRERWAGAFRVDDPKRWFLESRRRPRGTGEASEDESAEARNHAGGGEGASPASASSDAPGRTGEREGGAASGAAAGSGSGEGARGGEEHVGFGEASFESPTGSPEPDRAELEARWKHAGKSVRLDLETISRGRGQSLGDLRHELEVVGSRKRDLREFLRQFSRVQEAMRVSPDEFDYVFYAYGLELYGNMLLIENLEYREESTVHNFVIVIDTSGSVEGEVVREFVEAAYDVITQGASSGTRTNVHVVQCDAAVRSDVVINSADDLRRWSEGVELVGFGGTDFRPAFRYVDSLVAEGKLGKVNGLIYFTDGWGVYPKSVPHYKCAFVFYDENYRKEVVPPWAVQFVLSPRELKEVAR
jgi:hypothetical protein